MSGEPLHYPQDVADLGRRLALEVLAFTGEKVAHLPSQQRKDFAQMTALVFALAATVTTEAKTAREADSGIRVVQGLLAAAVRQGMKGTTT
jgi:hypothetical protein